jgi:hypothetical protein
MSRNINGASVLVSIRSRLIDRSQWPRGWWWPVPSSIKLEAAELRQQHDQTSLTINNVLLTLVGFCFFCWLALAGLPPDVSEQRLTLPFAGVQVGLIDFLLIGPLILVAFYAYLHVFVGYWSWLSSQLQPDVAPSGCKPKVVGLPFFFNLPGWTAASISNLLFYWLVPSTLIHFAWTSRPGRSPFYYEEEAIAERWIIGLAAASSLLSLVLLLRRRGPQPHRITTVICWVTILLTIVLATFAEREISSH